MTWLLKLYPPDWRRRYGDEFVELVGAQPFSFAMAIDVVAGAIDAWTNPQITAAPKATAGNGAGKMTAKTLKLRYDANLTPSDRWKARVAMVGCAAVLSVAWAILHDKVADNPYTDVLAAWPFFAGLLFSLRWTSLKGRSARTQAIFIGANLAWITAIFLLAGWIGSRL